MKELILKTPISTVIGAAAICLLIVLVIVFVCALALGRFCEKPSGEPRILVAIIIVLVGGAWGFYPFSMLIMDIYYLVACYLPAWLDIPLSGTIYAAIFVIAGVIAKIGDKMGEGLKIKSKNRHNGKQDSDS